MLLLIDNYDSFTYNIVQYLYQLGAPVQVIRNDELSVAQIEAMAPERILISPGPCTPNEAGISVAVIQRFYQTLPILGVCLGHQAIGQAFGGRVVRAQQVMHGKTSQIVHQQQGLFAGLPSPFQATRYHSLVVQASTLPDCLQATAWVADDAQQEIMGLEHRQYRVAGVQFHPESVLSEYGHQLFENFLAW